MITKTCAHKYVKGGEASTQSNLAVGYIIKVVIFCEKCGDFKSHN